MGWTGWSELGGTTGSACSTLVTGGKLYLFANGLNDKKIYYRSRGANTNWSGWDEFGGMSDAPLSSAIFNNTCHFFVKGMSDQKIYYRSTQTIPGTKTWNDFGGITDTALAAAAFNNRLYLFSKGKNDKKIYFTSRGKNGGWGQWAEFGGTTDAAVSTVVFKNRLYVFAKGVDDKQIYVRSRGVEGNWDNWWSTGGVTDVPIVAVEFGGDLHLFAKGVEDDHIYAVIVGSGNDWSPWYPISPVSATTDTSIAAANFNNTLHLFAKGISDKKIYTQSMFVYELPFDDDGAWTAGGNWDDPGGHGPGEQAFDYDFSHPVGGNVRAARSGEVVFLENNPGNTNPAHPDYNPKAKGYGTAIHIRHDDGSTAAYIHLLYNSTRVQCHQRVAQGDIIALSGDTGQSSSPHLHFGIHSFTDWGGDCLPTTPPKVQGTHLPVYFKDKHHTAWRPKHGDSLASSNS